MLEDKTVVLDAMQQHSLAKWTTLKAMMAQYGHEADMQHIPTESYDRFYESRALPVGAQVRTGRYGGAGPGPLATTTLACSSQRPRSFQSRPARTVTSRPSRSVTWPFLPRR